MTEHPAMLGAELNDRTTATERRYESLIERAVREDREALIAAIKDKWLHPYCTCSSCAMLTQIVVFMRTWKGVDREGSEQVRHAESPC